MSLTDAQPGSSLGLKDCDGSAEQRFDFKSNGQIVAGADPTLCLTVKDGASNPGGGGNPTHLLRRLTVERCSSKLETYQKWRTREKTD